MLWQAKRELIVGRGAIEAIVSGSSFSITATATKIDTVGGTSVTYNSGGDPSIGTADANRIVVVAIFARLGATATVSGVTIDNGGGAVSMNRVSSAAATITASCCSDIFYLNVTTGTTATIAVTYNGSSLSSAIEVYSVITSTPSQTPTGNSSSNTSASALNQSLAIPSGGGLISVVGITANPGAPSFTWSTSGSSIVEDADTGVGTRHFSAAHDTADAGTTPLITATYTGGGGATNMCLSLVAFGP